MNYKLSDIFIAIAFGGLIIGTGFMQTGLKNEPQVLMILFGLLTVASLFAKQTFKTSLPFYMLLGTLLFINIFMVTNLVVNALRPDDGWFADTNGQRHSAMQMNWVWSVLVALILASLTTLLYHKKIQRNKVLEISLTAIFIIVTTIIYIKDKLL